MESIVRTTAPAPEMSMPARSRSPPRLAKAFCMSTTTIAACSGATSIGSGRVGSFSMRDLERISYPRSAIPGYDPPGVTLALEQSLLAEFTAATQPARTIVWESAPALVVSLSDKQLPRYANAANASAAEGWPVAVRSSGGTAGPRGPPPPWVSLLDPVRGNP